MARLKELYDKEIRKNLVEKFGYKNVNMAPRIEKIVINTCSRDALQTSKTLEFMRNDLTQISGQKAVIAKAKKSVAAFKLREGQAIGSYVTLRGKRMYEFLDRFISVSLPRVRDFRGISPKSFDGRGNYSLGVIEQIIFPEIDIDKVKKIEGLNITFVTSATTDKEAKSLLTELGLPFKKN